MSGRVSGKDRAKWQKTYREKHPDRTKNTSLKKAYGITLEAYNQMSAAQNHSCAICKQKETRVDKNGAVRFMPVDHCHKTGKIRALLCTACNTALGGFKDDPNLLRKAAAYVEKYLAQRN